MGAIIALGLSAVLDSDVGENAQKFYVYIISAAITLVAATIALSGNLANIDYQNRVEQERRKALLRAAKAFLPVALSEMSGLCRSGMRNCIHFQAKKKELGNEEFQRIAEAEMKLSDHFVTVFKEVIIYSEPRASKRASELLCEFQKYSARLKNRFDPIIEKNLVRMKSDRFHDSASWAYLSALCDSLYKYARGESESTIFPIESDKIMNGLLSSNVIVQGETEFKKQCEFLANYHQKQYDR